MSLNSFGLKLQQSFFFSSSQHLKPPLHSLIFAQYRLLQLRRQSDLGTDMRHQRKHALVVFDKSFQRRFAIGKSVQTLRCEQLPHSPELTESESDQTYFCSPVCLSGCPHLSMCRLSLAKPFLHLIILFSAPFSFLFRAATKVWNHKEWERSYVKSFSVASSCIVQCFHLVA